MVGTRRNSTQPDTCQFTVGPVFSLYKKRIKKKGPSIIISSVVVCTRPSISPKNEQTEKCNCHVTWSNMYSHRLKIGTKQTPYDGAEENLLSKKGN